MIHLGRAFRGSGVWETRCGLYRMEEEIVWPLAPDEERTRVTCRHCAAFMREDEAAAVVRDIREALEEADDDAPVGR